MCGRNRGNGGLCREGRHDGTNGIATAKEEGLDLVSEMTCACGAAV